MRSILLISLLATTALAGTESPAVPTRLDELLSLVESPYASCRKNPMIQLRNGPRKLVQSLWQDMSVCTQLPVLPPTPTWQAGFTEIDQWLRAGNLAALAGRSRRVLLEKNVEILKKTRACLVSRVSWASPLAIQDPPPSADECVKRDEFFTKHLFPDWMETRLTLATALSPWDAPEVIDPSKPEKYLNRELNRPLLWPITDGRSRLEPDELEKSKEQWTAELVRIRQDYEDRLASRLARAQRQGATPELIAKFDRELRDFRKIAGVHAYLVDLPAWQAFARKGIRTYHLARQKQLLSYLNKYPALGLLKSRNPQPSEIVSVLDKMIENNVREENEIDRNLAQIENFRDDSLEAMFELTAYPNLMETLLADHPEDCAMATALAFHHANRRSRDLYYGLAKGGGAMAVAYLVPPAGVALTVALVGHSVYESYRELDNRTVQAQLYPTSTRQEAMEKPSEGISSVEMEADQSGKPMTEAYLAAERLKLELVSDALSLVAAPQLRKLPLPGRK